MMEHILAKELLTKRVHVHLVGVGGNGAQMAACLARLDVAMRALGHPYGMFVTAIDDDVVTEANVGRQLYSRADIGQLKVAVTIHRLNLFYGLDWESVPSTIEQYWHTQYGAASRRIADILVSCVDSRSARRAIHDYLFSGPRYRYWLDLGNREADGQVVLGMPYSDGAARRLPCVTELFSELLDTGTAEDTAPSCSLRLSLASQGLFVNDFAARYASQLLYELFSRGGLTHHGVVFNLRGMRSRAIAVEPEVWRRFGHASPR